MQRRDCHTPDLDRLPFSIGKLDAKAASTREARCEALGDRQSILEVILIIKTKALLKNKALSRRVLSAQLLTRTHDTLP